MAFSMNGSNNGGFGRSRFRGTGTLSEINVVPLVDVVLVLLIIFMLTAHVMEFGMEIDVPKTKLARDTAQELPVPVLAHTTPAVKPAPRRKHLARISYPERQRIS